MATPNADHLELLHRLQCMDYNAAVLSLKDQARALKTAWECTLNGWVDRGVLTAEGRALVAGPIKTNAFTIVNLGPGPLKSEGSK